MSHDEGKARLAQVPVEHVEVGAADPARADADAHLARTRARRGPFHLPERSAASFEHHRAHAGHSRKREAPAAPAAFREARGPGRARAADALPPARMEELSARFAASVRAGKPDPEALNTAGEPEPARAAEAFARAATRPDLAASVDVWSRALLRTARPGFGAEALVELARRRASGGQPPLDVARAHALPLVLGNSNFLVRLLHRHPAWADDLTGDVPAAPEAGLPAGGRAAGASEVRLEKYRGLLRIAGRDLVGRPFGEGLRELSDLADRCLEAALAEAAEECGLVPPALFALGKLGGQELNFSSDVDLLFVYEPPAGGDDLEHNADVGRLVRWFKHELEAPSEDGFAYRVDLDLRPEGRTGALANSVDAALAYYETFGAEWERQMLIRLRPVAGPADVAEAFSTGIAPFVYRRLIDPGVMQSVREMKARIEVERREAGRDLDADVKEGPGGIRDVEFLVQSLQLFYGGRHPELRTGNVLDALRALDALDLLTGEVVASLLDGYTWLRRLEHSLQLVEEQQTARFPADPAAQIAVARRMGYPDAEARAARESLLEDRARVRTQVRMHFEALVLRGNG